MPFLLAEILNFQGSTHRIGVGSFSHVNLYPTIAAYKDKVYVDSNTSHVNLYLRGADQKEQVLQIQIHLMLIFIGIAAYLSVVLNDSNTSHVNLYPFALRSIRSLQTYSNTSHVNLYQPCSREP